MQGGVLYEQAEDLGGIDWEEHWVRQVWSPVLFRGALSSALSFLEKPSPPLLSSAQPSSLSSLSSNGGGGVVVVEIGPSPVLSRMARPWIEKGRVNSWIASLDRNTGVTVTAAAATAASPLADLRCMRRAVSTLAAAQEGRLRDKCRSGDGGDCCERCLEGGASSHGRGPEGDFVGAFR